MFCVGCTTVTSVFYTCLWLDHKLYDSPSFAGTASWLEGVYVLHNG